MSSGSSKRGGSIFTRAARSSIRSAAKSAGSSRGTRLVGVFEQVRPQRGMRLLAVPGAAVRRPKLLRDAHDRTERRQIREGIERGEDEEARAVGLTFGFGERGRASRPEERDRMSGGIASAEQRPVDGAVEGYRDGAQRRERVPIEAARRNQVDSQRPAPEDGSQRRRATRTRGRG